MVALGYLLHLRDTAQFAQLRAIVVALLAPRGVIAVCVQQQRWRLRCRHMGRRRCVWPTFWHISPHVLRSLWGQSLDMEEPRDRHQCTDASRVDFVPLQVAWIGEQ